METAEFVIIGEPEFAKRVSALVDPASKKLDIHLRPRAWSAAKLATPRGGPDFHTDREMLVRDLCAARLVAIDMNLAPNITAYLLGVREALTTGITLACHEPGQKPAWALVYCTPKWTDLSAQNATTMEMALTPLKNTGDQAWTNDVRATQAVHVNEVPQVLDKHGKLKTPGAAPSKFSDTTIWKLPKHPKPEVRMRFGDIGEVTDVDCWVNSENVSMQMAREIEKSISARIRYLGSRRTGLDRIESDDAIFLELARAMGSRRRLAVGEVLMTSAPERTDLAQKNNVKVVAHVATVVPVGPGQGFGPGNEISRCVTNVLRRIHRYAEEQGQLDEIKTVLMPLFAAGDAGVPASIAASQMIEALGDWIESDGAAQSHFDAIYFMARDARSRDAIAEALDARGFEL